MNEISGSDSATIQVVNSKGSIAGPSGSTLHSTARTCDDEILEDRPVGFKEAKSDLRNCCYWVDFVVSY